MFDYKNILYYSYKYKFGHIPSALSIFPIVKSLYDMENISDFPIIIGKSFGAQAWFIDDAVRENFINSYPSKKILDVSDFIHSKFNVVYAPDQLGLAAGFSCGYALGNKSKTCICILSDADIFLESTQQAIFFAHRLNLPICFIIDYNKTQLFGSKDCEELFKNIQYSKEIKINQKSFSLILVPTKKGNGCPIMEESPKDWHYRIIDTEELYEALLR